MDLFVRCNSSDVPYQMNGNRGIFLPFQPGYHAKEAQRAKVAKIGVALEGKGGGEMIFQYLIKK